MSRRAFILANTAPVPCLNIHRILLYQANEIHDLWHKTQDQLDAMALAPPFWAFAWAGGEGLARYILDNPEIVAGKRVLDFASGSGLVAIAARQAGADSVIANDIDPYACDAIGLNASLNKVSLAVDAANLVGRDDLWDVVLAGDIFYDKSMTEPIVIWLHGLAKRGATVLAGDPGRAYRPLSGLTKKARYRMKVSKAIEEQDYKDVQIWQFCA